MNTTADEIRLVYNSAKEVLDNVPIIFIKKYLIDNGYVVKKVENKPDKFNDDFYKV